MNPSCDGLLPLAVSAKLDQNRLRNMINLPLSVIILHYGSIDDTINCIESLASAIDLSNILVIDNSKAQLLGENQYFKSRPRLIVTQTGGGLGFAAANNLGVNRISLPDGYWLFLNNDTISTEGSIATLVQFLERNPVCGACGPCMPYYSDPTSVWACGGKVSPLKFTISGHRVPRSTEPHCVDYLPGAAVLVRSELFKMAGGFDTRFFLGHEEAALCRSIKRMGFSIQVVPSSIILHKVGISSIRERPELIYNSYRNIILWGQFCYGLFGEVWGTVLVIAAVLRRRLAPRIAKAVVLDHWRGVEITASLLDGIAAKQPNANRS